MFFANLYGTFWYLTVVLGILKEIAETSKINIQMPGYTPNTADNYACTYMPLAKDEIYVTGYQPLASMSVAHHILLYVCNTPFSTSKTFPCNGSPCRGEGKIIYAWGRQAPALTLPEDTAFQVGGKYTDEYLVLQVHYLSPLSQPDYSGVTLLTSAQRPLRVAGIFGLFGDYATIPPKTEKTNVDVACRYTGNVDLKVFAFRVHAHMLGTKVMSYKIPSDQPEHFIRIGRANPQWPQAFYPAEKNILIHSKDLLVARCVYNSSNRTTTTHIGQTHMNEMCNFYMMFSIPYADRAIEPTIECTDNLSIWTNLSSADDEEVLPDNLPSNFFTNDGK